MIRKTSLVTDMTTSKVTQKKIRQFYEWGREKENWDEYFPFGVIYNNQPLITEILFLIKTAFEHFVQKYYFYETIIACIFPLNKRTDYLP